MVIDGFVLPRFWRISSNDRTVIAADEFMAADTPECRLALLASPTLMTYLRSRVLCIPLPRRQNAAIR